MFYPAPILYVISILCVMTSAEPKLSLNVAIDVTFTCNMTGNYRKMARLLSLQIIRKHHTDPDKDVVLASVDKGGVVPTKSLSYDHPFHSVTGKLYYRRWRDSWLKLTIYNFEPSHDGVYACQINYLDHPADTYYSFWEATVTVDTSTDTYYFWGEATVTCDTSTVAEPKVHHDGFSVSVRRGMFAVCEHEGLISYSALEEYGSVLASWVGYGESQTPGGMFPTGSIQPRVPERLSDVIGESHIPVINCDDFCKCYCSVQSLSGQMLTKSSTPWPFYHCPQQDQSTTPWDVNFFLYPDTIYPEETAPDILNQAETAPLKHFTVGILVSVVVAVIIVAVVGFVILRLRKARRACFKRTPTPGEYESDNEAGESLNDHPKGKPKDVDVRKSPEEQSLSGSDRVSIASSVGGLGLDVRPETSSV